MGRRAWLTFAFVILLAGLLPILTGTALGWDAARGLSPMPMPERDIGVFREAVAVLAGFVVKPAYMLLSLILLMILRRRSAPDLFAVRLGLLAFLLGESFCAANYLAFGEASYLVEYLHMLGMALAFGAFTYALLEGLDARLVHYTPEGQRCAARALCPRCAKEGEAPCGFVRLFLALSLAGLALSAAPWCTAVQPAAMATTVFGAPYVYSHPAAYQLFELRWCPSIAAVLFAVSWFALRLRSGQGVPLAKAAFSAGAGFLGFGVFRLVLFSAYRDDLVWFVAWEELTELLALLLLAYVLWVFRRGLLPPQRHHQSGPVLVARSV